MPTQQHEFGKYQILRRIAAGGMGEVHLAKLVGPSGFEKLVVIKRLLQSRQGEQKYVDMFFAEARVAAQLGHSNIVQVYEVGTIDNTPYIAMEYVHGKSLRKVLDTAHKRPTTLGKDGVPVGFIAYIVSQLCAGLAFAHDARHMSGATIGLVHRDINPHNILISYQGEVKIIDFGIAKSELSMDQTQAGTIKGTVVYMSPEQSLGQKLDKRSDLFSVGICLYEALTGKNPFHKSGMGASLEAIRQAEVPALTDAMPHALPFAPILAKALAKDRQNRYGDCAELGERLTQLIESGQVARPPVPLANYMSELFGQEMLEEERLLERTDMVRNPLLTQTPPQGTRPALAVAEPLIIQGHTEVAHASQADADGRTHADYVPPISLSRQGQVAHGRLKDKPAVPISAAPPVVPEVSTPVLIAAPPPPETGIGFVADRTTQRVRAWLHRPQVRSLWPFAASFVMLFGVLGTIALVTRPQAVPQLPKPPQTDTPTAGSPTVPPLPADAGLNTSHTPSDPSHAPTDPLAANSAVAKEGEESAPEDTGPTKRSRHKVRRSRPDERTYNAAQNALPLMQVSADPPLTVQYKHTALTSAGVQLDNISGTLQVGQNPDSDPFIITLQYRLTPRGISYQVNASPWADVTGPGGILLGRTPLGWTEPGTLLNLEFKNPHVATSQRLMLKLTDAVH
jgi:serine/threonine protein kinase